MSYTARIAGLFSISILALLVSPSAEAAACKAKYNSEKKSVAYVCPGTQDDVVEVYCDKKKRLEIADSLGKENKTLKKAKISCKSGVDKVSIKTGAGSDLVEFGAGLGNPSKKKKQVVVIASLGDGDDALDARNLSPQSDSAKPANKASVFLNVDAGAGDDAVRGSDGPDTIFGGEGDDRVAGGAGADHLEGQAGDDALLGGEGDDSIFGGLGDDVELGEEGDDGVYGNEGDDLLTGGNDNDYIEGGEGNDSLAGDQGNDHLQDNDGNDRLTGGEGEDILDSDFEEEDELSPDFADIDGDGLLNEDDPDDDNDGILDVDDPDMDGDGELNETDWDPDGDGNPKQEFYQFFLEGGNIYTGHKIFENEDL
ncbi:MAG: hypothetical protein K1X79_12885 [Oligoflexia bacterium]|nr:hypothetical protein [Oligoflexia bacterium]